MQSKQHNDDFGAFLESVQKAVSLKPTQAPMRIMATLSQRQSIKVTHLISQVKMPWSEFTDGLRVLEEAGLVTMDDDEEEGVLRLTKDGLQWAQVMLPEIDEDSEDETGEDE